MPLQRCISEGRQGWSYGADGKCYVGPGAKERAAAQGRAIEANRHYKSASDRQRIRLMDEELHLVWAEVYVPDFPDTQGHIMSAVEVRKMAHKFLASGNTRRINLNHSCNCPPEEDCNCGLGSSVVESFIARPDDMLFAPGAWVAAIHVPDDGLWEQIKNGDINGFSMEAMAFWEMEEIELEIPDDGIIRGFTGLSNPGENHEHGYSVRFNAKGKFVGGQTTSTSNGPPHTHKITQVAATDKFEDHSHRFSVLDALNGRVG